MTPRSCWEPAHWFAEHPDAIALWGGVPGTDILSLQMDMMHIKWLGIDAYYIASLLVYIVDHKLPSRPQVNLHNLWLEIAEQYKKQNVPTRLSCLTLNMIRANKAPFPALKAKAAEIKCLIPVLVHVAQKYLDGNPFEKLIYKGLLQSWSIDQCLSANMSLPRFLRAHGEALHR